MKNFVGLALVSLLMVGCSIYQSDGHKALEKNTAGIITVTGFHPELAAHYTCVHHVARPTSWSEDVVSLNEFVTEIGVQAALDNKKIVPTVLVYSESGRSFEGCTLEILDEKASSVKLKNVVLFGQDLLQFNRGQE